MNIGIYTGYWSTNIGNSFFQLGEEFLLKKVFPNAYIYPVADEPGYINPVKGNPGNAFNPVVHQKLNYAVVLGPFIRPEISKIILPTLRQLKKQGTKILAMGVGMMDYREDTIKKSREILQEIDPDIFITRDRETFEAFCNHTRNPYDGIDLGFFSSDLYTGSGVNGKYIVLNFDQLPEPLIREKINNDQLSFHFEGKEYEIVFQNWRKKLHEKGFKYQLLDRLLFQQTFNKSFGEYDIIRTDHRYNPVFLKKIYALPNTFSSDIPHPYWAIYKNSALTISNRVHACVATLSFGNPAMLFTKSPRSFLLDRVGANDIKSKPVKIDLDVLQLEKENMINFIKETISL